MSGDALTPKSRDDIHLPDPGNVDVWRGTLSSITDQSVGLRTILSEDEAYRCRNFIDPGMQQRFVASRVLLRLTLGSYLHVSPRDVPLASTPEGKPVLISSVSRLRFNLSRSKDCLLIAVANGQDVGVDVETIHDEGRDVRAIAQRFFAADEAEYLKELSGNTLQTAFLVLWVRKEALIKAHGRGMALVREVQPLRDDLPIAGASLDIDGKPFTYTDLNVGQHALAALALEGTAINVVSVRPLSSP